jgi:hypothetical protein
MQICYQVEIIKNKSARMVLADGFDRYREVKSQIIADRNRFYVEL